MADDLVFLVDVDNTLLDNGTVVEELKRRLVECVGADRERRYWQIFEALWAECGYADYLGALQRLRSEEPHDQAVSGVSTFLVNYPFVERLYPGALEAITALQRIAPVVILTDGDAVYQPNKIERAGLRAVVGGHVLVYVHKEDMLEAIERRYPARRYVMIDDKLRVLAAIKAAWGERVTTVFVRQGQYAHDPAVLAAYPAADVTIERIGDLITITSSFQLSADS